MKSYKLFENNNLTSDELLEKYNDVYNEAINCGDIDAANQAKIELDNITKKYNTAECENSDNNKILTRKIASISSNLEEKRTDKRKLANKLFNIIRRTI